MRASGAENSLIYEWLALLRRHYRIFNVDNSHRCHALATHEQRLLTPEEEELRARKRARQGLETGPAPGDNIVQPFVWAPQFYGCTVCGRYHICRRDERECEVVWNESDQQLTCLHSHQLLRQATSYVVGNFEGEVQFEHEHDRQDDDRKRRKREPSSERSRYVFKPPNALYTNSRARQPHSESEVLENLERVEARDDAQREQRRRQKLELAEAHETGVDEAAVVETMVVEQSNTARLKNMHDNYAYWNAYFGFLLDSPPECREPSVTTGDESLETVVTNEVQWPDPASLWRPHVIQPQRTITLSAEARTTVEHTAYEVVCRLMKAQHRSLGRKQPTTIDALNRRIVESLLPVLENIIALCQHQHQQASAIVSEMTLRNWCIALLLFNLCEPFFDINSHGHRIEVWHRQAWLAALQESGVTESLFAPRRRKNQRTKTKQLAHTHYDQTQIKAAQSQIERLLSGYRGHGLWLRDFVLKSDERRM